MDFEKYNDIKTYMELEYQTGTTAGPIAKYDSDFIAGGVLFKLQKLYRKLTTIEVKIWRGPPDMRLLQRQLEDPQFIEDDRVCDLIKNDDTHENE